MSDSDSDDSILNQAAFTKKRPSRQESLAKKRQEEYLQDMLDSSRAQTEKQLLLQRMELASKQRDIEREERRLENEAEKAALSPISASTTTLTRSDLLGLDTVKTATLRSVVPTASTLYQLDLYLPASNEHALDCLDRLLYEYDNNEGTDSRHKTWISVLGSLLEEEDSLELTRRSVRARLVEACPEPPLFFWQWLILLTCHVKLPHRAVGAHEMLQDLLQAQDSHQQAQPLFGVQDMIQHWKLYFGAKLVESESSTTAETNSEHEEESFQGTMVGRQKAIGRFLDVWSRLLEGGRVGGFRQDEAACAQLLVWLVVVGSDSLCQDENRTPLRRLMGLVLHRLERVKNIAECLKSAISSTTAQWSFETYALGWVHLCSVPSSLNNHNILDSLVRYFMQEAMGFDEDEEGVSMLLEKYSLPKTTASSRLLVTAYMALSKLDARVRQGKDGTLCLAVLEVTIAVLAQVQDHAWSTKGETAEPRQAYLGDLLEVSDHLLSLSKIHVLSQDAFQHFNYYLLIFNQYLRLQKPKASGVAMGGLGPKQGTLDAFLVTAAGGN